MTAPQYIGNYYDKLYNLMIGGNKNKLIKEKLLGPASHEHSEQAIRSIIYSAKIDKLLKELDNTTGAISERPTLEKAINNINTAAKKNSIYSNNTPKEVNVCDLFPGYEITTKDLSDLSSSIYNDTIVDSLTNDDSKKIDHVRRIISSNMLSYIAQRFSSVKKSSPTRSLTASEAIDIYDITNIPFFQGLLLRQVDTKARSNNYPSRMHIFFKDYNIVRPLSLDLAGNVVEMMQVDIEEMDSDSFKDFRQNFLKMETMTEYNKFVKNVSLVSAQIENVEKEFDSVDADESLWDMVKDAAVDSYNFIIEKVGKLTSWFVEGSIKLLGLWISDKLHLPEINKFINDTIIKVISMITVGNISMDGAEYKTPQVQEYEYIEEVDQRQKSKYSSYISSVISPLTRKSTIDSHNGPTHFLMTASPGMYLPTTALLKLDANTKILNEIYERVQGITTTAELDKHGMDKILYKSYQYNAVLLFYQTAAVGKYRLYITDPKKAVSAYEDAQLNTIIEGGILLVSVIPGGVVLGRAAKGARMYAQSTKTMVTQTLKHQGKKGLAIALGKRTWRAAKKPFAYLGGKIASAFSFLNKADGILGIFKSLGMYAIVIALIPIVVNIVIIILLLKRTGHIVNYLFMNKLLPVLWFFGSIVVNFSGHVKKSSTAAGSRIGKVFETMVENPVIESIVPFFRMALELVAFYFIFVGIIDYILYNNFANLAIWMYENGYSLLFEAGLSIVIMLSLWITHFIYQLIDKLYPSKLKENMNNAAEGAKF